MMNEPWLLLGFVCLPFGIREQWKFNLIICLLNFNTKHITKPAKQGCVQFFIWRREKEEEKEEKNWYYAHWLKPIVCNLCLSLYKNHIYYLRGGGQVNNVCAFSRFFWIGIAWYNCFTQ
jgi:hypothetical protein